MTHLWTGQLQNWKWGRCTTSCQNGNLSTMYSPYDLAQNTEHNGITHYINAACSGNI
uniref:Uncharacterized protein n=1 Tax=Anguilla anguilla TaxID=7936 RepID=A0A0E9U827_ANGAN